MRTAPIRLSGPPRFAEPGTDRAVVLSSTDPSTDGLVAAGMVAAEVAPAERTASSRMWRRLSR
jgi:hypothetical protein